MAERCPNTLRGLLRFCMTAGDDFNTDMTEMDEERRNWLSEALKGMTVDIVEQMKQSIHAVIDTMNSTVEEDINLTIKALQNLIDTVEDLDCANDFVKIGGLELVEPLLDHTNSTVRSLNGCLIGELMQNNPFCQDRAVTTGLVLVLITAIKKESDAQASQKLLYGLSCIVRGHPTSLEQFLANDGLTFLTDLLARSQDPQLSCRASFMLRCITTESQDIRERLSSDIVMLKQLILYLRSPHSEWHEHIIATLISISNDEGGSRNWCQQIEHLDSILKNRIYELNDDQQDTKELMQCLLEIVKSET